MLIWIVIPNLSGSTMTNTKNFLRFIIICQYIPRLFLIFPLSSQIVKATGVVTETAWAGAAYNLMLYMLASHVSYCFISSTVNTNETDFIGQRMLEELHTSWIEFLCRFFVKFIIHTGNHKPFSLHVHTSVRLLFCLIA